MNFIELHQSYLSRLNESVSKMNDLNLLKKRLTYIRWKVAENLDKLLFEFETNIKKTDAHVNWCPDATSCIDVLNKHLKPFTKINFFQHNAVRHLVRELDMKVPDLNDNPEVVVIGAKFLLANTGNFYSVFNNFQEFEQTLNAKKIIVIGGIDSILALQSELYLAKQLYAIFETGNLHYQTEILSRPGRIRGINAEIVLLLTDLNKSNLLDLPMHRSLFSLSNFDLGPVCPIDAYKDEHNDWKRLNSLDHFINAFVSGMPPHSIEIFGNNAFSGLNAYIPYDIDLYDQVLDARALQHESDKSSIFNKLLDTDKLSIALNAKKFQDKLKFHKFAERNIFGPFN